MSDELESLVLLAGTAYSEGRFQDALQCYERAILAHPTNAVLYANTSAILLRLSRIDEALQHAERAIQLHPHWAKAHYRRGEALRRSGLNREAVVALCEGTRLDPSNSQILNALLDVAGTFFAAFPSACLRSLHLDSNRFTVLTTVGQYLLLANHTEDAIKILLWALSLESPSLKLRESALSSLASAYFRMGNHRKALQYYEEQLEVIETLGGCVAEVSGNIARAAESDGQWILALLHRQKRLGDLPQLEAIKEKLSIAELHLQMNQPDEAIEIYEGILREKNGTRDAMRARVGKGIAHGMRGETVECLAHLENVNTVDEEQRIRILDAINGCHLKDGNLWKSIEYLNRELEKACKRGNEKIFAHACCLLCRSHICLGNYSVALRIAKRILHHGRHRQDHYLERAAYRLLATIYENQHDPQSAFVLLEKYLEVPGIKNEDQLNVYIQMAGMAEKNNQDVEPILIKAVNVAEKTLSFDTKATAYSKMIRFLINNGKKTQAIVYLNKQKKLLEEELSSSAKSLIFEDIALYGGGEGRSDDQMLVLEQSLTEAQEGNNLRRELELLEKIGDGLLETDKYKEAEGFYLQFLALAKQLRVVNHMKKGYTKLARLKQLQLDWSSCVDHARSSLALARIVRDTDTRVEMLLLMANAEMRRNNLNVSRTVLDKTISLCKASNLHSFLSKAYRLMVELSKANVEDEKLTLEYVRNHISMFTFENDEEAICKSLVDLAKLSRENAIATLKVIKILQNRISFLNGKAKESILLDCFDVSLSISMVDEAIWFFLEAVRNILDWTEELASRLELLPTGRRSLPLLILVEKDLIPPYILTQAAFLCPRAVLTKERSSKKTIDTMLVELVCYFKQENWTEVLHSLEKFSSINESLLNSAVKRLSLDPVILIQMHLRVIWELKVEIVWNLVRQLNETSLRSFFDMTILSSELSFHSLSDKIVRLHSTILRGGLEQVKTADKVDRIISGVMTGNVDMVAIWYTEVIEEFLSEPCDVRFNPFPFSTIEFKLMVVSVIVAILQDSPEEQLHTLEMSKWHIDNRQMLNHGCGSPNKPQINLEGIQSLIYTYRVGRVSVSWALNEDKILISYKTLTEYLSFYEECIVRILRLRGYSRKDERMLTVENGGMLISNTHMEIKTQYRHLWMRESATQMRQYSIGLLVLYQSLNPKEEFVRSCSIRLYLMMRKIAQSKIFLVNVTESFLSKEIILAANAGPQIIISVGRLDFDVIRAFFLCGTQALVEVPIDVSLDDVDCLLSLLLSGELISMACPVNYIIYGNSSLRITSISSLANLRETIREDPTSFYAFARMVREKRNKCDVINRIAAIISDMDADEWAKISCIISLRDTQEINSIWNAVQDDRLDELKGLTEALKEPNALPFFRSIYDDHLFCIDNMHDSSRVDLAFQMSSISRKSKKKWKGQRTRSKSGYTSDGGELVRQCISRTRSIRNIPKYMCSSAMVLSVEQPPHNITAK